MGTAVHKHQEIYDSRPLTNEEEIWSAAPVVLESWCQNFWTKLPQAVLNYNFHYPHLLLPAGSRVGKVEVSGHQML